MPEPLRDDGETVYPPLALAVADINWFTTANLFRESDEQSASVLALRCMDYRNGWNQGIYPWSRSCRTRAWGLNSVTRDLVLPSGWMKRFPRLGMRPIARAVREFWDRCEPLCRRAIVMTYPHYLYLRDQLRVDSSLYYNIDDYSLYWPRYAAEIRSLEREMVLRAQATICVANSRAEELRKAIPEAAGKIHHLPHGTPAAFLAEDPQHRPAAPPDDLAHLPRPLLGYVGSIEGRVDWPLLNRLAGAVPSGSIVVVGKAPSHRRHGREAWFRAWLEFSRRPNVHLIGWRPQEKLPRYYRGFDVILIPYAPDHPFNRACCPTKIADGLGSGRPIVATALPECRLYSQLFEIAEDAESFLAAVRSIIASGSDDGRADARHAHAREHTCRLTARRVMQVLAGVPAEPCLARTPMFR
jgi:glycosyltransferase involved in cell wall biosynthesis